MKKLLAVLLLLGGISFAQGGVRAGSSIKATAAENGAVVRVCTYAASGTPCSPTASIYSDAGLSIVKANPFTVDSTANYTYYAAPGLYKEQLTVNGSTVTQVVQIAVTTDNAAPWSTAQTFSAGLKAGSASMYDPAGNAIGNRIVSSASDIEGNSMSAWQHCVDNYCVPNVFRLQIQPTGNTTQSHIGLNSEVWTVTADSTDYTGAAYAFDGSFVHGGSGHMTTANGVVGEIHNAGPGTIDTLTGTSGTAICGGADVGAPVQHPSNDGHCGTNRGLSSSVTNLTANKVTVAESIFAGPIINTGGGGFGTAYGLHVSDISGSGADTQWQSYFEGAGVNRFQGQLYVNGVSQLMGAVGLGTPAITTTQLLSRPSNLTGVTQTGIQSAPITTSAAVTEGIGFVGRADTAAAVFTQVNNYSFYGDDAIKGAGSAITNSYGFYAKLRASGASNFGFFSETGNTDSFGIGVFKNSIKVGASGSTISDSRELVQSAHSCGTTSTCANTANASNRTIFGTVALTSASPSTATVTAISPAFTSSSSYVCTATPTGASAAIAAGGIAISYVSGSSFTLTGPNTVSTVINYICIGN